MDVTEDLDSFWSSLVSGTPLGKELKALMAWADEEERAIQLLCRALFLVTMGLKQERDVIDLRNREMKRQVKNLCSLCRGKWISTECNMNQRGEGMESKGKEERSGCDKERQNNETDEKKQGTGGSIVSGKSSLEENRCTERIAVYDTSKKRPAGDYIVCISAENKKYKAGLKEFKVGLNESKDSTTGVSSKKAMLLGGIGNTHSLTDNQKENIVLAYETEVVSQQQKNNPLIKTPHITVVPETLVPVECDTAALEHYGNTDFYDCNVEEMVQRKVLLQSETSDVPCHLDKDTKLRSPSSPSFGAPTPHSPILGKQLEGRPSSVLSPNAAVLNMNNQVCNKENIASSPCSLNAGCCNTDGTEVKSKNNKENLKSVKKSPMGRVMSSDQNAVKSSKSKKAFPNNDLDEPHISLISPAGSASNTHDELGNSPSLLQGISKELYSMQHSSPDSSFKRDCLQLIPNKRLVGGGSRQGQGKAKSVLCASSTVVPSTRLRSARNTLVSQIYTMEVEPAGPNSKKSYKQTKLTPHSFTRKTGVAQLTGGLCTGTADDVEARNFRRVLEESLHTKELEDMMRKKAKELRSISADSYKNEKKAAENQGKPSFHRPHGSPSKNEPTVLDKPGISANRSPEMKNCSIISPAKSQKLVSSSKQSSGNTDSRFHSIKSSVKKCTIDSASVSMVESAHSQEMNEEEILQVLEHSSDSPFVRETAGIMGKGKKDKKIRIEDSFDVPTEKVEPAYAYRGNCVRRRHERAKMDGWECPECKNWYDGQGLSEEEKKALLNRCSRHRSKYNPITSTPKNFWNPDWDDTCENN